MLRGLQATWLETVGLHKDVSKGFAGRLVHEQVRSLLSLVRPQAACESEHLVSALFSECPPRTVARNDALPLHESAEG